MGAPAPPLPPPPPDLVPAEHCAVVRALRIPKLDYDVAKLAAAHAAGAGGGDERGAAEAARWWETWHRPSGQPEPPVPLDAGSRREAGGGGGGGHATSSEDARAAGGDASWGGAAFTTPSIGHMQELPRQPSAVRKAKTVDPWDEAAAAATTLARDGAIDGGGGGGGGGDSHRPPRLARPSPHATAEHRTQLPPLPLQLQEAPPPPPPPPPRESEQAWLATRQTTILPPAPFAGAATAAFGDAPAKYAHHDERRRAARAAGGLSPPLRSPASGAGTPSGGGHDAVVAVFRSDAGAATRELSTPLATAAPDPPA